jgi:hypothetical protein
MFDFRDFTIYLKNPNQGIQFDIKSIPDFLKLIWKSFLILLVIDIIIGLLIVTPLRYFNLYPSLKEIKFTPVNILKISLLLPIIEELIFRLPLRISKINFASSFSLVIFLVLHYCIFNIYLSLSISIIFSFSLYLVLEKESSFLNRLIVLFTKYFWQVFYFQALIFGFLHLTNYFVDFRYFYLFPFFVLSYIISGLLWGYIRMRYTFGIYLCIVSHIIVNSIYCLVLSR